MLPDYSDVIRAFVAAMIVAAVALPPLVLILAACARQRLKAKERDVDLDTDVDPLGEVSGGEWALPPGSMDLPSAGAQLGPALRSGKDATSLYALPVEIKRDYVIGKDTVTERERGFPTRGRTHARSMTTGSTAAH